MLLLLYFKRLYTVVAKIKHINPMRRVRRNLINQRKACLWIYSLLCYKIKIRFIFLLIYNHFPLIKNVIYFS